MGWNHTAKSVVAEVEYIDSDLETRHSDIGPYEGKMSNITPEYRKFLHDNLDEWLDKSDGTGIFFITGEPTTYLVDGMTDASSSSESSTCATEKILSDRIDHLEEEITKMKRALISAE